MHSLFTLFSYTLDFKNFAVEAAVNVNEYLSHVTANI